MVASKLPKDRLIDGEQNYGSINHIIDKVILDNRLHTKGFYLALTFGILGTGLMLVALTWLIYMGIGIWGNQIPVGWAWGIVNFVWWIGIGHAGTLISAILLLLQQQWRNSINRFAEAMTIFAVMCAGIYPLLHTGRPWNDFWLFPYPNIMGLWPQYRSPLFWDVCAVSTYFTVSLLFWYMGLVPDMASLRDRATNKYAKYAYAIACLGWRGSAKHWHRYEQSNIILAAIATPLVLSVHSTVSFDMAMSIVPGWNPTMFPPYFVAGAVYGGFAMVLNFAIPIRKHYKLQDLITMNHIDWMCKIMLATSLIVFYSYGMEVFFGWYSGSKGEVDLTVFRFIGGNKLEYWMLLTCNCAVPALLWFPKVRKNLNFVWCIAAVSGLGMWLERYVIIPMSLQINPLPSMDRWYHPTFWDIATFIGTIGFFMMMMMLFVRALPTINIAEVKDLLYKTIRADGLSEAHQVAIGGAVD